MSKSNASAKNRRAYGGNPPPSPIPMPAPQSSTPQNNSTANNSGFTLQQVIAVIDRRLLNLETFMKETSESPSKSVSENVNQRNVLQLQSIPEADSSIQEILSEYNARFDMLVEEITSLKDIVLKLQSYTMDVNKTLLEERIQILSDLGSNTNEPELFDLMQNENNSQLNNNENVTTSVDLKNLVKEEFSTST
jgi:hypothetical protein